jgi:hypothetical protein
MGAYVSGDIRLADVDVEEGEEGVIERSESWFLGEEFYL